MNLTKKNNELKWANFITTLEIKNPIYADVKIVAFENDTVYHNLKAVYALKVSHQTQITHFNRFIQSIKASKLKDNIEVLEKKCTELREKSKQKQEERRLIMTETKVLLKTKGEILTNYDKRKYQLLIEKDRVHHRLSHLAEPNWLHRRPESPHIFELYEGTVCRCK